MTRVLHSFPWGINIGWSEKLLLDWQQKSNLLHSIFTPSIEQELYIFLKEDTHIVFWSSKQELITTINKINPDIIIQHGDFYDLSDHPIRECWYMHVPEKSDTCFPWYAMKPRAMIASTSLGVYPGNISHVHIQGLGIEMPEFPRKRQINYVNPVIWILGRVEADKIPLEFIKAFNSYFWDSVPLNIYWRAEESDRNGPHKDRIQALKNESSAVSYHWPYIWDDLSGIFEEIDIVVIASAFETWSYVALESQSFWVPVFGLARGWLLHHIYDKDRLSEDYVWLCANISAFFRKCTQLDVSKLRAFIGQNHEKNTQIRKLDRFVEFIAQNK